MRPLTGGAVVAILPWFYSVAVVTAALREVLQRPTLRVSAVSVLLSALKPENFGAFLELHEELE